MTKKVIILDRDGVINYDSDEYIKSPDEWKAIPGSLAAIAKLNKAGFTVIVTSNQSGIARGYYTLETLENIHEKMMTELEKFGGYIDKIYFCPHVDEDHCDCRKPKPGLFLQAQKDFDIDFKNTFYVADKTADMQLAAEIGCKRILVLTGYGQTTVQEGRYLDNTTITKNLAEAVEYILRDQTQQRLLEL